jgi:hypothetical protein
LSSAIPEWYAGGKIGSRVPESSALQKTACRGMAASAAELGASLTRTPLSRGKRRVGFQVFPKVREVCFPERPERVKPDLQLLQWFAFQGESMDATVDGPGDQVRVL